MGTTYSALIQSFITVNLSSFAKATFDGVDWHLWKTGRLGVCGKEVCFLGGSLKWSFHVLLCIIPLYPMRLLCKEESEEIHSGLENSGGKNKKFE